MESRNLCIATLTSEYGCLAGRTKDCGKSVFCFNSDEMCQSLNFVVALLFVPVYKYHLKKISSFF